MSKSKFTWREAMALLVLSILLIGLLLPASGDRRVGSRRLQNNTQLWGIHQGMVRYADKNNGYYPGLNADGTASDLEVAERFRLLLEGDYFHAEKLINPHETEKVPWTRGPVTVDNYSYAMLQVPASGGRYDEWRETMNPEAIVLSDRNIGSAAEPEGILTGRRRNTRGGCVVLGSPNEGWAGSIVFNDNWVLSAETHVHDTVYDGVATADDHIFQAAGEDDAYMIHTGN